jgi:hypothetical protein
MVLSLFLTWESRLMSSTVLPIEYGSLPIVSDLALSREEVDRVVSAAKTTTNNTLPKEKKGSPR